MEIYQTINDHRKSNSYFLKVSEFELVVIDVGDFDINCFLEWLLANKLKLRAVILTHEHSDHCFGVNQLSRVLDFDLYVSENCQKNIRDPKKNYSKFIDKLPSFSILRDSTVVNDNTTLLLGSYEFKFLGTPGHSAGSMCIITENFLFSGDTVMNYKTPLHFPDSDKTQYLKSIRKIFRNIDDNTLVFPGHGTPFEARNFGRQ